MQSSDQFNSHQKRAGKNRCHKNCDWYAKIKIKSLIELQWKEEKTDNFVVNKEIQSSKFNTHFKSSVSIFRIKFVELKTGLKDGFLLHFMLCLNCAAFVAFVVWSPLLLANGSLRSFGKVHKKESSHYGFNVCWW